MAKSRSTVAKVFSCDSAALVLRVVLGLIFIFHGGQKMIGWFGGNGWSVTINAMSGQGFPAPLVVALIITEFVGGICILIGLLTRFWAMGLVIAMLVATYSVGSKAWSAGGESIVSEMIKAVEFQLSLAAMALALVFAGPGRWAVGDIEGWLLGVRPVRE